MATKITELQHLADRIYGEGVAIVTHHGKRYELTKDVDEPIELGTFDEAHDFLSERLPEDSGDLFSEE